MCEHHLGDPDGATPAYIIRDADPQLPLRSVVADGSQEDLNLFDIALKERTVVSAIAEPEKGPELLFESVLNLSYLLLDAMPALIVYRKGLFEEHNGQVAQLAHLYLVRLKKFRNHGREAGKEAQGRLLRRLL